MDTSNLVTVQGTLAEVNIINKTCQLITAGGETIPCSFPDILARRVIDTLGDKVAAQGEAVMNSANGQQPTIAELKIERIGVLENGPYTAHRGKPVTAQALIDLGFFELGEGRDDLGDIHDYPRQLRKRTWYGEDN
jgi:hypothetical protein